MTDENTDILARCQWPPLDAPYDAALGAAVAFIFTETEPVGIIATGTIVRGAANANSDLDIYVIHAATYRRRIQKFFNGVPAEIFINPPAAIRGYFVEEHRDGRRLTAHMLSTGFIVYSASPVVDELHREASDWLARAREMPEMEATTTRYGIASRLEDGLDVAESDPHTAKMLIDSAVTAMLEYFCKARLGRIPRSKELLAAVSNADASLGEVTRHYYSDIPARERVQLALVIADRTIAARGFFEWDSGPGPID